MRILFLITGLNTGGAETQLLAVAKMLKANKFCEPIIVSMISPPGPLEEDFRKEQISVFSLGMSRGKIKFSAIVKLYRLIKKYNIQILHSHMVHANILGRFIKLICPSLKVISTIHNINMEGRFREKLLKYTELLSNQTTIISEVAKEYFVREKIISSKKLIVIPNGINTDMFNIDETRRRIKRTEMSFGEKFVWLAVGRLDEQKNYPNLLYAYKKAIEDYSNHNSVLIIAGQGPLLNNMKQLTQDLGIMKHVRFLGLQKDISHLMNAADAFVLSSSWEGLPIVLLEALASGLPVVSTNVGGNREIVFHNENGFLVEPDNSDELSRYMVNMMNLSPEEVKQLGKKGREIIKETNEMPRIVSIWESIYSRLSSK